MLIFLTRTLQISKKMEMNILIVRLYFALSMGSRDHLPIYGMTFMTEKCMRTYVLKRVENEH